METKFNRLTIIEKTQERQNGKPMMLCKCVCGEIKKVRVDHLQSGRVKSCGCWNRENLKTVNKIHGHVSIVAGKQKFSGEYISWRSMKQRCLNPRYTFYKNYGGRGITVSDLWKDDFSQFLRDMGERPAGTTLDRIDNEKGYFAGNCRWADRRTQNKNRRQRGTPYECKELVQG